MTQTDLKAWGFRWTKPTWETTADRQWLLIVPVSLTKADESGRTTDPREDRTQRYYEVFSMDGSWVDHLHEVQVENLLRSSTFRLADASLAS